MEQFSSQPLEPLQQTSVEDVASHEVAVQPKLSYEEECALRFKALAARLEGLRDKPVWTSDDRGGKVATLTHPDMGDGMIADSELTVMTAPETGVEWFVLKTWAKVPGDHPIWGSEAPGIKNRHFQMTLLWGKNSPHALAQSEYAADPKKRAPATLDELDLALRVTDPSVTLAGVTKPRRLVMNREIWKGLSAGQKVAHIAGRMLGSSTVTHFRERPDTTAR